MQAKKACKLTQKKIIKCIYKSSYQTDVLGRHEQQTSSKRVLGEDIQIKVFLIHPLQIHLIIEQHISALATSTRSQRAMFSTCLESRIFFAYRCAVPIHSPRMRKGQFSMIYVAMQCCKNPHISCLNCILKFKKEQKPVRKGKINNKPTKLISGVRRLFPSFSMIKMPVQISLILLL